jgi:hypothetical protein
MSNPQQPELARSRKTPAQDPDASAAVLEGQSRPDSGGPSGPIPVDNQPGHHPAKEQDKPDLDAFAAKLGVTDAPEDAAAAVDGQEAGPAGRRIPAVALAGALTTVIALVLAVLVGRRRRSRS